MHKRILRLASLVAGMAVGLLASAPGLIRDAAATVNAPNNTVTYTGNGVTAAFATTFSFLQGSDLVVTVAGVTKTLGTHYTVSGAGNATGTVTFTTAPANLAAVIITRTVDYLQKTSLKTNRTYDPANVEKALDKLAMGEQQLQALYTNPPASVLPAQVTAKLNGIRFADQFANIQAAITDAGTTGAVLIPSTYVAGDTFTNPNAIPIIDLRGGAGKWRGSISAKEFGAVGNNSNDDTASVQAALNAGVREVLIPAGTYLISSKLTVPNGVSIRGEGYLASILKKNFNGDLIDLSGGAMAVQDISLDGNAPSKTGRTVVITGGAAQWFDRVEIKCLGNAGGYCVEYTAVGAGTQSWIANSTIKTSTAFNVAVKYPTAIENGFPRMITNTQGNGSILIDFGGSNDAFFVGNFTNGLVFSANTTLAYIANNRIATTGAPTTVSGQGIMLIGNAFAGDVTLDASTTDVLFFNFLTGGTGTVTNSGVRNTVILPGQLGGNLKIISGLSSDGAGYKHSRATAGCATAASVGATCTTTVTWTTAFPNSNYTVTCMGSGIASGVPLAGGTTSAIAASVNFVTVAATAAAAQFSVIECVAVHD